MSQTDPIADFLTRIRNGLHADHDDVEMPASTFKAELARILREQGYIEDFEVEPGRVGRILRVRLKYTENRKPVISGHAAHVQARPAPLRGRARPSRRCRAAWAPRSSPRRAA